MFNYFRCPRCFAQISTPANVQGAWASPACTGATCRGALMMRIGGGEVEMAAPAPPPGGPPAVVPVAPLPNVNQVVHQGQGSTNVGLVTYVVEYNPAMAVVVLTITVDARPAKVVRLHGDLLVQGPGWASDWLVLPPSRVAGAARETWLNIPRNLPVIENLAAPMLATAPRLPNLMNVRMKLGNHAFGLIHLLAGHHDNARTHTVGIMAANTAEDETYRTTMGVQMLISTRFAPSILQQINRNGDKWLLLGTGGALLVVSGANTGILSVTTVYIADVPRMDGEVAWKRKVGR